MDLLRVVDGGRARLRIRMLVIDVDMSIVSSLRSGRAADVQVALSVPEIRTCAAAQAAGLELAVITSAEEHSARRAFESAGLRDTLIISDVVTKAGASECSQARLDCLAEAVRQRGCSLREIAVIATHPVDCPMMLEAGVGFALKDAGRDAARAADRVFPPRRADGLATAIDAVVALVRASYTSASKRSWLMGR